MPRQVPVLLLLALLSMTFPTSPAGAQTLDPTVRVSLGVGRLWGSTSYLIGDHIRFPGGAARLFFPLSKLSFPVAGPLGSARVHWSIADRLTATGCVGLIFRDQAGRVKDSDWGVFLPPDPSRLDIYSTSLADHRGGLMDAQLRWQALAGRSTGPPWSLAFGLGYQRRWFSADVRDLDQGYPSHPFLPHDLVKGAIGRYDVHYSLPYLLAAGEVRYGEHLALASRLGFSPLARADDRDDHRLRAKKGTGSAEGFAGLADLEARWAFTSRVVAGLRVSGLILATEGRQVQTRYRATDEGPAGWIATIDQQIKGQQASVEISLDYSF